MSEIADLKGQVLREIRELTEGTGLIFDSSILNAYTQASLDVASVPKGDDKLSLSDLSVLLGHRVEVATEVEGDRLCIQFDGGCCFTVPIDDDSRPGVEAAWYYELKGSVSRVW
jgi:hypothetical protein